MKVIKKIRYCVDDFELKFEPIEDSTDIKKVGEKYEVKYLVYENDPINPRTEWDNFGKITCWHNKYELGDKTSYNKKDYSSWNELVEDIKKNENIVMIFPLYLYDHSGITISMDTKYPYNDYFDSMQVGFIYVTKEDLKKEKVTKKQVQKILEGEVKIYDQYLRGEVYVAVKEIFDSNKNSVDYDTLGSIFGYDAAEEELKDM